MRLPAGAQRLLERVVIARAFAVGKDHLAVDDQAIGWDAGQRTAHRGPAGVDEL
jgi:hypothetical protein